MRPFGLPHCQPQGGTRSERPSRLAGRAPRPAPYSITRAGSSPDFAANYPSRRYCITQSFCNHDIRRLITGLCPELCPHGFLRVMRIMQSHSPAPHHRSLSRIILLPRYWMTLGGAQSHASPDFSPNYVFSDSSASLHYAGCSPIMIITGLCRQLWQNRFHCVITLRRPLYNHSKSRYRALSRAMIICITGLCPQLWQNRFFRVMQIMQA
jgi:hypothetical protein